MPALGPNVRYCPSCDLVEPKDNIVPCLNGGPAHCSECIHRCNTHCAEAWPKTANAIRYAVASERAIAAALVQEHLRK